MPRIWPGYLAVWAAVLLHGSWVALLLLSDTRAYNATPLHALYVLVGSSVTRTVALLAGVVTLALVGLVGKLSPGRKILYLLPQQLLLGISAAGSIQAIYLSRYADGIPRPASFVAADQLPIIITWLGHTAALVLLSLIHWGRLDLGGRVR